MASSFAAGNVKFQPSFDAVNTVTGFLNPPYAPHDYCPTFERLSDRPMCFDPHRVHSVRLGCHAAPPETCRASVWDRGTPYPWNGIRIPDARIKCELTDDRKHCCLNESLVRNAGTRFGSNETAERDKLANKFIYTSSTQRMYENVQWDEMLRPKRWKPITTVARPVSLYPKNEEQEHSLRRAVDTSFTTRNTEPPMENSEGKTTSWLMELRQKNAALPPGLPIKLYSLDISQKNRAEPETETIEFQPLTVPPHNSLSLHGNTSHRPNIPGYAGYGGYQSLHRNTVNRELQDLNRIILRSGPVR